MGRIIIVTLLWSEILSGYNTPDTMIRDRIVKVGHEIRMTEKDRCSVGTNDSIQW